MRFVNLHFHRRAASADDVILQSLALLHTKADKMQATINQLNAEVDAVVNTMNQAATDIGAINTELTSAADAGDEAAIAAAIAKLEPVRAALNAAANPPPPAA